MQTALDLVITLLAFGGGAGAVLFALFRWLGAKWIDDRLARGLEALKLEQSKELAQTQAKWDADLHGLLKYQEREFTAVGEAWRLLQLASEASFRMTSPFSLPFDLHFMGNQQLKQFLDVTFTKEQVLAIVDATDQAAALDEMLLLKMRADCEQRLLELAMYINANFPFIPEPLYERLDKAHRVMSMMLGSLRLEAVIPNHAGREGGMETGTHELQPLIADLQLGVRAYMAEVRSRLGAKA